MRFQQIAKEVSKFSHELVNNHMTDFMLQIEISKEPSITLTVSHEPSSVQDYQEMWDQFHLMMDEFGGYDDRGKRRRFHSSSEDPE